MRVDDPLSQCHNVAYYTFLVSLKNPLLLSILDRLENIGPNV